VGAVRHTEVSSAGSIQGNVANSAVICSLLRRSSRRADQRSNAQRAASYGPSGIVDIPRPECVLARSDACPRDDSDCPTSQRPQDSRTAAGLSKNVCAVLGQSRLGLDKYDLQEHGHVGSRFSICCSISSSWYFLQSSRCGTDSARRKCGSTN